MVKEFSFYEKLVPYIHKLDDPQGAIKAIVDGSQEKYNELRKLALEIPCLVDLDCTPCDLLSYLANHVGLKVESCDPCDLIREQIRAATPIYKVKGTNKAYVALLRTLGFDVEIFHLFEDAPDSANTLDDVDAITGFNQRVAGFNAGSRIRIELAKLPEAIGLDICGQDGGLLSSFLLSRVLGKIREITPIHIDVLIVFTFDFIDTLNMTDELSLAINHLNRLNMGCCCYHGKGGIIVNQEISKWDDGYLWDLAGHSWDDPDLHWDVKKWDAPNETWDELVGFEITPIWDTLHDAYWDVGPYTWDWYSPRVVGEICTRGEENAFTLNRFGWTKTAGVDLMVNIGSDIVTSASSLFEFKKVIVGDFVQIEFFYYRITEIISETQLRVLNPFTFGGTFEFEVVFIESWHRRQALHKNPLDTSLPTYVHDIMLTFNVQWDIPGETWDSGAVWDDTGLKHDCCDFETNELVEHPNREAFRLGDRADGQVNFRI